jgi:hypothetical protein
LGLNVIDQIGNETHIDHWVGSTFGSTMRSPTFGKFYAGGVDNDEPILISNFIPVADPGFVGRPLSETVNGDHQRGGFGWVIGIWDIEEIRPPLTRGNQRSVGPIDDGKDESKDYEGEKDCSDDTD